MVWKLTFETIDTNINLCAFFQNFVSLVIEMPPSRGEKNPGVVKMKKQFASARREEILEDLITDQKIVHPELDADKASRI